MPSAASANDAIRAQPAAKQPAKTPDAVLAEAEKQWLFTPEELARTPSIEDGMSQDQERELRNKGLNFIMQVGIMLKLPQLTLSTAAIFFNRFLMRYSLVNKKDGPKRLHHYQIAAVALFLATKTEENCRKIKEIIVACCRVAQKNPSVIVQEDSKDFWRWRDTLLLNEDVLLETLCFDLSVEPPHQLLFDLLKSLGAEHNKKLRNAAWGFLNDSCLTMLCLQFSSRTIAAAAVYAGAKYCGDDCRFADDHKGRPWWEAHRIDLQEIRRACNVMASLYEQPPEGEPTIYVGLETPVDGAEDDAKTRLRSELREQAPDEDQPSFDGPALMGTEIDAEKAASEADRETVSSGVKRDRDGTPKVTMPHRQPNGRGGDDSEDAANKKLKTQTNGSASEPRNPHGVASTQPQEDEGSEEGEVEE